MCCVAIAKANANITAVLTELPSPLCRPGEGRQPSGRKELRWRSRSAVGESGLDLGNGARAHFSPSPPLLTFPYCPRKLGLAHFPGRPRLQRPAPRRVCAGQGRRRGLARSGTPAAAPSPGSAWGLSF